MGDDRLSICMRELLARKSLCANVEAGPWIRVQDLYAALLSLHLEARPNKPLETDKHLLDLRKDAELLSIMFVGSVIWATYRDPRRGPQVGRFCTEL